MSTIRVHAEVDLDDVLYELDDEDLIEELQNRGYNCSKDTIDPEVLLTKEEIDLLIAHIDIRERPLDWVWQRVRDKLMVMDYKK
jgi:hypothetical protein